MSNIQLIAFAIGCITLLAIVAFSMGIDGVIFTGAIGTIGGIVGFRVKVFKDQRAEKGGS